MNLKMNSIYKHYKGKYYKTLFLANNASNNGSVFEMVVYQALYNDEQFGNNPIWVRSVAEFTDLHDGVNPRFEFVCCLD
ncbi:MAG: DUF1653 domain-containing protein [Cyanobacteriota bacterium]|jgi:hypothetical protein